MSRSIRILLLVAAIAHAGGAAGATVAYFLDQSGNATAGILSVDGVNYAQVTISDDAANNEIDFTVALLPNVIAQFNPSASNQGIKAVAFDLNVPFTALSGTSATGNGFKNLPGGSGFNWTTPSSKGMDGFGTFEVKLENTGSARASTLSFSLDTSTPRWSSVNAANFFELSTGSAPQGNVAYAIDVDGIATAGAQGGNPFFGGVTPVPVPAAAWLLLSGLGVLGFAGRRAASRDRRKARR